MVLRTRTAVKRKQKTAVKKAPAYSVLHIPTKDAALVFEAAGGIKVLLPNGRPEDFLPTHALVAGLLAAVLGTDKGRADLLAYLLKNVSGIVDKPKRRRNVTAT